MICVDTSLVVRALTDEEGHERAVALFEKWRRMGESLIAPSLLPYEVASAFCRKTFSGDLKDSEALEAYRLFLQLGITLYDDPGWIEKAFLLAQSFRQRTPYDFAYLVAAEAHGTKLYTADRKFVELVSDGYPFVKYYS